MKLSIIYIAGYGRSGSTLLDLILNSRSGVFGLGEIVNLFTEYNSSSSNLPASWKHYVGVTAETYNIDPLQMEAVSRANDSLFYKKSELFKQYTCIWNSVFKHLYDSYPGIYVDSSKTTWRSFYRPLNYIKQGAEVKMIHLIRSPIGVMQSAAKGDNRKLERGDRNAKSFGGKFRALLSWYFTNILTVKFYKNKLGGDYMYITYEDLTNNPEMVLREISTFLGISYNYKDLETKNLKGFSDIGISGNRMRRQDQVFIHKAKNSITKVGPFLKWITGYAWRSVYKNVSRK